MELHHLRALHAIARTGSLTAAAELLHCTQSALSHLISDLERSLGVRLVERDRRPVAVTAAGARMVSCAAAVLPQVAALADDLGRIRQGATGRLLISLECHSCIEWLAPAMASYRARHPQVDLDLRMGATFDPLPSLTSGAVDMVITSERSSGPGVRSDALFRYQIMALVPERSPLRKRAHLEPRDFSGQTVITYPVAECRLDLYTRFLDPAGIVPLRRRTAELTAMIVQWVASGQGVAALPSWALTGVQAQVAILPLGRTGLWTDLHALRRERDQSAAHLDDFIGTVRRESFTSLPGIVAVPPPAVPLRRARTSAQRRTTVRR